MPNKNDSKKIENQKPKDNQPVKITDFDMPFGSLVSFLIKFAVASIPALMILFIIAFFVFIALFSIFGSIMFSLFSYS